MSVDRGSPREVIGRMGHSENLDGIRSCTSCGEIMLETERHTHELGDWDRLEAARQRQAEHYAALYACEHWRYLDSSWNGTIENPSVGPYEGYCPTCGGFFKIIGFAKLAGRRVCSDPVRQGDTA
jgi:predicted RNA-binding Zn-ribbon protein involved in translation (DUF1610 family)